MQAFNRREEALQDLVQGLTQTSDHPPMQHTLLLYMQLSGHEACMSCTCHNWYCFCSEVIVAAHIPGTSRLAASRISFLHAPGNCTAAAFLSSG